MFHSITLIWNPLSGRVLNRFPLKPALLRLAPHVPPVYAFLGISAVRPRPRPALANSHRESVSASLVSGHADSSLFSNERPVHPEENGGSVDELQPAGGGQEQMRENPAREFSPSTQESLSPHSAPGMWVGPLFALLYCLSRTAPFDINLRRDPSGSLA